jgi:hypothetical protein
MTDPDRDPDWLLGLAQVRAQAIIRLVQLCEDGEAGYDGTLEAIREQAQAILDGDEPNATP